MATTGTADIAPSTPSTAPPAASAAVVDDRGRLLLGRRADTGCWALIGGILDPGEEPADGVVREVLEETGVAVEPEALVAVSVSPMIEYPNGDRAQYLDLVFRCRAVGGSARPADDENVAVGWFRPEQVPELDAYTRHCLELALGPGRPTVFTGGTRG